MKKTKKLVLKIPHAASKRGSSNVDFGFLEPWLGKSRAQKFARAIQMICEGGKSANHAYNVRKVLQLWKVIAPAGPAYLAGASASEAHEEEILKLRLSFYQAKHDQGRKFSTSNNAWRAFLKLLNMLAALKEVPRLNYIKRFPSVPGVDALQVREGARAKVVEEHFYPSSLSHEMDAFHTGVIVPISLSLTDAEYLEAYEKRLGDALGRIRHAAICEIDCLVSSYNEGAELIASTDYEHIRRIVSSPTKHPLKNTDPENGLHFFREDRGHPNLLGNLLAIVENEMGGIPTSRVRERKDKAGARVQTIASGSHPHWHYISHYGKNRLLPYLGILTSRTMVPFLVLILLEHPRITVSALLRARFPDENSVETLLIPDLDEEEAGVELEKPRARKFKSMRLTSLSKPAVNHLIKLTGKARERLKGSSAPEDREDAKSLWVGIHMIDYRVMRISEKQLTTSFRVDPKFRAQTDLERATRLVTFADTHFQGDAWRETITLKSLRVSAGVYSFVKGGGDIVTAAKTLGHKNTGTTINHYVPRQLQIAIYEHKIRRHQNLLMVLSSMNQAEMLEYSDFDSTESLHSFLSSIAPALDQLRASKNAEEAGSASSAPPDGRLVVHADPYTMAVAMLYKEHVASWPDFALDRPDSRSGVTPRAWSLLVESLEADLPDSMYHLTTLVSNAATYRDKLRSLIRFPGY